MGRASSIRLCATALVAGAATLNGCGDILHSTDWGNLCADGCGGEVENTGSGGAGEGAGGETGSGATHSAGGGEGGAQAGGAGGDGGDGPMPASCGNGVIEDGETCDDANGTAGDGCEGCLVVCNGAGEIERSATHACYLQKSAAEVTWQAARDACIAWGGNLLAIADADEQNFVETFIAAHSWMGATDAAMEGTFVWTNGEPFGYTNWLAGEPNEGPMGEDCVEVFAVQTGITYTWNDVPCSELLAYICERSPPSAR